MNSFKYIISKKASTKNFGKLFSILSLIFFILVLNENAKAQFPATFSYQAVARNSDGTVIANKQITVEVSILQGNNCESSSGSCNLVWQEVHFPTTNDLGLFSINIGEGQSTFAGSATNFSDIQWSDFTNGNYYLRIRADFGTGNNLNELLDMGTVKLQSVPYAISTQNIARTSGKVPINLTELSDVNINSLQTNQVLEWDGTQWINTMPSASGATTLNELSDVSLSSPATNEVLYFNGTSWVNSSLTLDQLSNVNLSSPTTGQSITFDGSNWVNSSVSLSNLSDVSISSPSNGQSLVWNGTAWVNQPGIWTDDGTNVYYNGGKKVGIGTTTPRTRFELATTASEEFLVSGTTSSNTGVDLSAGAWMRFLPAKGVFRAGAVTGSQWANANTGDYSAAFGLDNTASGAYSFASGRNNTASGIYSFASGRNNTAAAAYSFAMGYSNSIDGSANGAFVIGNSNSVDVNGAGAFVTGTNTQGRANYASVFGVGNTATSYAEMVIGRYNNSPSSYSVNSWNATEPVFVIGNGSDASNKNNALVIYKNGNISTEGTLSQSQTNPSKAVIANDFLNILKLNAYTELKNNGKYYGFSADEVEKFFPSFVVDFNKTRNIAYTQFIPLMIETIKYQQNEIDSLKTQNKELQKRLDDIELRLEKLENR